MRWAKWVSVYEIPEPNQFVLHLKAGGSMHVLLHIPYANTLFTNEHSLFCLVCLF